MAAIAFVGVPALRMGAIKASAKAPVARAAVGAYADRPVFRAIRDASTSP
jgi:hypothetical protein